jgi:hypothetical protein
VWPYEAVSKDTLTPCPSFLPWLLSTGYREWLETQIQHSNAPSNRQERKYSHSSNGNAKKWDRRAKEESPTLQGAARVRDRLEDGRANCFVRLGCLSDVDPFLLLSPL